MAPTPRQFILFLLFAIFGYFIGRITHPAIESDVSPPPRKVSPPPVGCPPEKTARKWHSRNTSWYYCLNEHRPAPETRCYFRNVCVRSGDSSLLFFSGNGTSNATFTFRKPLFYLDKTCEFPKSPLVVPGPPPKDARWFPGVAAFFRSYMPVNFGHALDDNFFALWRLLRLFEMEWDEHVLFLTQDHRECGAEEMASKGFDPNDSHCTHLKELGGFFGIGTYSAAKPPEEWKTQTGEEGKQTTMFCARHLLAGTSKLTMRYDLEGMHDRFVEDILCRLGLNPRPARPTPARIGLFEKHGRRRVLNNAALADALRSQLGLEAEVLDIASYSFPEQIKLMQAYSLVISPAGGISFTAQFLPPTSSVIYVGGWNIEKNTSMELDRHILTTRRRVRDYYYPLGYHELRANDSLKRKKEMGDVELYRNFVDVVVDTERMVEMVRTVLEAEPV